ncbi:Unknown protein sequence [Pseudomonas syringae pv. maculicola]|nr:Unknown protein sequence [Pseudomonas syringae pv. maculicola]
MAASLGLLRVFAQLAELLGARQEGAGHGHAGAQTEAPAP